MSQAVIANGFVFLAGQIAENPVPSVTDQTRDILAKIDALLAEAGSDKKQIVSATIWLADISTFAAMNEAWDAWVPQGHAPARATVEAKLAAPQFLVEIGITATV
jgi:enamine deaminase RidA (YjgF/YER057c/UK114 family)